MRDTVNDLQLDPFCWESADPIGVIIQCLAGPSPGIERCVLAAEVSALDPRLNAILREFLTKCK